jgi:hypothetical protein
MGTTMSVGTDIPHPDGWDVPWSPPTAVLQIGLQCADYPDRVEGSDPARR